MTRTGKIARLPRELRDELNLRLERGLPGREIVDWLNALPEVTHLLTERFHGIPVSEQNLSEWRKGGFAEWHARNDFMDRAREFSHNTADLESVCGHMADHAARLLALQYAQVLWAWHNAPPLTKSDETTFLSALAGLNKAFSPIVRDITALRRGDHTAAREKRQQQAFEFTCERQKAKDAPRDQAVPPKGESHSIKPDQTTSGGSRHSKNDKPATPSAPAPSPLKTPAPKPPTPGLIFSAPGWMIHRGKTWPLNGASSPHRVTSSPANWLEAGAASSAATVPQARASSIPAPAK